MNKKDTYQLKESLNICILIAKDYHMCRFYNKSYAHMQRCVSSLIDDKGYINVPDKLRRIYHFRSVFNLYDSKWYRKYL